MVFSKRAMVFSKRAMVFSKRAMVFSKGPDPDCPLEYVVEVGWRWYAFRLSNVSRCCRLSNFVCDTG